jgi:hypothetical protein
VSDSTRAIVPLETILVGHGAVLCKQLTDVRPLFQLHLDLLGTSLLQLIVPGDPLSQLLPSDRLGNSLGRSLLLLLLALIPLYSVKVYIVIEELRP